MQLTPLRVERDRGYFEIWFRSTLISI